MKRRNFIYSGIVAAAGLAARADAAAALALPRRPYMRVVRGTPDVEAVTGDGRTVLLRGQELEDLAKRLHGRLLLSGDDGYDDARQILNPSFDRRPAVIAQVSGAGDVATAIDFARDHGGLLLAVKCGGHSLSGKSTCDRGMQIDLSRFRAVRVDPAARRAWVTGGSLLGSVDHETARHELVAPLGTVSHTGVGGLVTGGGFGRVGRRFGLSVDNLVAVDVVAADGRLYRASETENAELFWGVRGGGGNFGVVTNFEFRLHPMQRTVYGGEIYFPIDRARDVLRLYAEYGPDAPDEVQLDFVMVQPPGDEPGIAGLAVCYSGAASDVDRVLAPIRGIGSPVADTVQPLPYVELQKSGDVEDPRALGAYTKSGFITGLTPSLIDTIVDGFRGDPARTTVVFTQQSGGAINRVPASSTAFAQRDVFANLLHIVGWPFGSPDAARHIEYARGYWSHIEPHTDGFYANDLELETSAQSIRENFRDNHVRLVAVKNRYDPSNLFRLNANVVPTA